MNTNTDFDKIDKVLSKITGKELRTRLGLEKSELWGHKHAVFRS